MKRLNGLRLIYSSLIAISLLHSVSARAAFASRANNPASAQTTVIASAVVVPAQVADLGFLRSAIAREIPVQEGETVQAGQTLAVLDTPDLQFAVTEAEAALRSAQVDADLQKYQKVKNRRNGKIFYEPVPEIYRQRADVKVQQAQAALEIAQLNLTQGTLRAPFDGTVAALHVIPGEFVPSDQAIVTLATLDTFQVETTDLSERDIAQVQVGAPANVFIEALNENLVGNVIAISPRAETASGDVVFKVTIAFEEQPQHLLWGMTAEVSIEGVGSKK